MSKLLLTLQNNEKIAWHPYLVARTCGDPGKVDDSTYDFSSDVLLNSSVVYTCNRGYRKTAGNLTRICQAEGKWSGVKPVCSGELFLLFLLFRFFIILLY